MVTPENLTALFAEINTLATRLKQVRELFQDRGWPGGVRSVLLVLGRQGEQTVPDIARVRRTSRQNIQIVVDRLKSAGLIELDLNPAHKRSSLVRLTHGGRTLVRQIQEAEKTLLERVLAEISHAELLATTKCLHRLHDLVAGNAKPASKTRKKQYLKRASSSTSKLRNVHRSAKSKGAMPEKEQTQDEVFPVNLL